MYVCMYMYVYIYIYICSYLSTGRQGLVSKLRDRPGTLKQTARMKWKNGSDGVLLA